MFAADFPSSRLLSLINPASLFLDFSILLLIIGAEVLDYLCMSTMTVIHDKLPSTKIQVGELLLSSDSESEDEVVTQRGKKLSEKRRRENILFSAWEAQQGTKITEKESIQATQTAHNADDEFLSVQGLMAKTDSAKIIASPRDYQVDLCERAKKQNTIAVLDTGSGKTHIAVLLLQHTLDIELENRRLGVQPKVAFFLVSTVLLCVLALCSCSRYTLWLWSFSNIPSLTRIYGITLRDSAAIWGATFGIVMYGAGTSRTIWSSSVQRRSCNPA